MSALARLRGARVACSRPLTERQELHILHGMGRTLGDSIVGLSVLAWVKSIAPNLRIHVYRASHATDAAEQLYRLAEHVVSRVHHLPLPDAALPADAIDVSDFLYWPMFSVRPLVDFFLEGLGLAREAMPAAFKANHWLSGLDLPHLPVPWQSEPYVLLCDRSSTPLRSIPNAQARDLVDQAWARYGLPVLGFRRMPHPHYHDVSALSPGTENFLAWVRGAQVLVSSDTAAVHAAAGFGVPTLAGFVSIDPALRVRDYPLCRALDLRTRLCSGVRDSTDPRLLLEARTAWKNRLARTDLPWPTTRQALRMREQLAIFPRRSSAMQTTCQATDPD